MILDLVQKFEQIVDEGKDHLIPEQTGFSPEARQKAEALVHSFETYLTEHKSEIDALQFFYSVPHSKRLRFKDIRALADNISSPPRSWSMEKLWRAYEILERSKVRGASAQRMLTDIVSLVRFALHQDRELVPNADRVRGRFQHWLAQQANKGRQFSDEQIQWLGMMRDHIATSLEIDTDSFDLTPFSNEGGLARASKVFGRDLMSVVHELNEALAA